MLDEGRITQIIANLLMQSVDEAIDLVSCEPLCDWNGLKSNINMPNYYKFLQSSIVPQKLVTYFTVERLESACYICAAFLRAHRIARQQIHDFIGKNFILILGNAIFFMLMVSNCGSSYFSSVPCSILLISILAAGYLWHFLLFEYNFNLEIICVCG